jgi:predicted Zn-ribbon and HTH transcriptional regulator
MTRQEAIEYLREKAFQDYSGTPYEIAIEAIEKVMKYEKLERTGKLIRIPNCRNCKHAYKDDSRCYECIANMTCWPDNFEPRKKVKK